MKIALTIPGMSGTPIDSGLPTGVPTGGLFGTGQNIITTLFQLITVVAVFFALWEVGKGGIDMVMSRGIKEKFNSGRQRVIFGVWGLLVFFLSFMFMSAISAFFGVDLLPFLFNKQK